jgi:phosphoribosylformylglycinamidine synthase
VTVEVQQSPSIFFAGMEGSRIPIVVAHGEGFADFSQQGDIAKANVALRFVDNRGAATQTYPLNPNGSPEGITSVTTVDGRFTALMPHRARVPYRDDELGAGRVEADRRWWQPVDAHVP